MPGRLALPALPAMVTVEQARALGISRDVLRGSRFWSPLHGVYASSDVPDGLLTRARAVALVVPGATFSHTTAARLRGLPVPGRVDALGVPVDEPLEVTLVGAPPRRTGVRGHRGAAGCSTTVHDLAVTTAARTWADLGGRLPLDELVVLGDAVLRSRAARLEHLADAASGVRRGGRLLREALALLDAGADSPMETRLRLLLVRAGLPHPVTQHQVVANGEWLARLDLAYPSLRIAIEYDGDQHRSDRRQWHSDIARRRLLEDAGWLVIVVTADDVLRHPEQLVERVRRAVAVRSC